MINVAPIRAAAAAAPGDMVALSKAQLEELLGEVEQGQGARRHLQMLGAIDSIGSAPIVGGYDVGTGPDWSACEAQ